MKLGPVAEQDSISQPIVFEFKGLRLQIEFTFLNIFIVFQSPKSFVINSSKLKNTTPQNGQTTSYTTPKQRLSVD